MMHLSLRSTRRNSAPVISPASLLLRHLCTPTAEAAADTTAPATEAGRQPSKIDNRSLYWRLSKLGITGGKVGSVLHQYIKQGNLVQRTDLVDCLRKLRKFGRYQHCFEILTWMEKGRLDYSDREYALHLDIVCKLKGINEAEKYFDRLPSDAKTLQTYGALLNCYCMEAMTDKALALFQKMDELNYASTQLAFNNLMGLYMKVGQPEKVPPLVQEMKKRNISPNCYTHSILIQSYGCMNDFESLERVMDEIRESGETIHWNIYSNLAAVYVKAGLYEKAESALKQLEEVLENPKHRERKAYHFLMSLYASIGNSAAVSRAWDSLKTNFKGCNNLSYLNMLQALTRLKDIDGLGKCFEEWECSRSAYDPRLAYAVISAYLKHDMVQEAEQVFKDATDKAGKPLFKAHDIFMTYFLGKRQIDSAMRQLEAAVGEINDNNKWHLPAEKVVAFFDYFEEERDVDGAEEFCRMLKKVNCLDSKAYLSLLRTYVAAGKTAPELHQRMEEDGVNIGSEHEDLLEKVCPKIN